MTAFKFHPELETKWLPLSQMFVDVDGIGSIAVSQRLTTPERLFGYQRDQRERLEKILAQPEKFRPELVLPLAVNQRNSNSYAVVDGSFRYRLLTELGAVPSTKVEATIAHLAPSDEAQWFVDLNKLRVRVSLIEEFRAEVAARETTALEIQETLKTFGFEISSSSIKAVRNVREAHRRHVLPEVCEVLYIWRGKKKGLEGKLITGLAQFIGKAKKQPQFKMERLLSVLQKSSPELVIEQADVLAASRLATHARRTVGGSFGIRSEIAVVLVRQYNRGLRTNGQTMLDTSPFLFAEEGEEEVA